MQKIFFDISLQKFYKVPVALIHRYLMVLLGASKNPGTAALGGLPKPDLDLQGTGES